MATEVLEQPTEERLTRRRATAEEFWSLPESLRHIEYIKGEIVAAPTSTVLHQLTSRNIVMALHAFVKENALENFTGGATVTRLFFAPLDVALPSGDVVQPDLFFLATQDAICAKEQERVRCAPLFVAEILSPSWATHDTLTKRSLYERNGVREYWIVDVEKRKIAQLVLRRKRYVLTELGESDVIKSAVLAGFEMTVGELLGA